MKHIKEIYSKNRNDKLKTYNTEENRLILMKVMHTSKPKKDEKIKNHRSK